MNKSLHSYAQCPDMPDKKVPKAWQPQFGVGGLMLVMLVCCVMAATGYYLVQSLGGGRQTRTVFILFTLVAPLILVVAVSMLRGIWLRLRR